MPTRRLPLVLPVLLAVLTGCAASQPALRPADLPEHLAESPIVLHWRIDRAPDRATAVGLVEIPQNPDRVEMVMVELQGIDGQGRITNRAARPGLVAVVHERGALALHGQRQARLAPRSDSWSGSPRSAGASR